MYDPAQHKAVQAQHGTSPRRTAQQAEEDSLRARVAAFAKSMGGGAAEPRSGAASGVERSSGSGSQRQNKEQRRSEGHQHAAARPKPPQAVRPRGEGVRKAAPVRSEESDGAGALVEEEGQEEGAASSQPAGEGCAGLVADGESGGGSGSGPGDGGALVGLGALHGTGTVAGGPSGHGPGSSTLSGQTVLGSLGRQQPLQQHHSQAPGGVDSAEAMRGFDEYASCHSPRAVASLVRRLAARYPEAAAEAAAPAPAPAQPLPPWTVSSSAPPRTRRQAQEAISRSKPVAVAEIRSTSNDAYRWCEDHPNVPFGRMRGDPNADAPVSRWNWYDVVREAAAEEQGGQAGTGGEQAGLSARDFKTHMLPVVSDCRPTDPRTFEPPPEVLARMVARHGPLGGGSGSSGGGGGLALDKVVLGDGTLVGFSAVMYPIEPLSEEEVAGKTLTPFQRKLLAMHTVVQGSRSHTVPGGGAQKVRFGHFGRVKGNPRGFVPATYTVQTADAAPKVVDVNNFPQIFFSPSWTNDISYQDVAAVRRWCAGWLVGGPLGWSFGRVGEQRRDRGERRDERKEGYGQGGQGAQGGLDLRALSLSVVLCGAGLLGRHTHHSLLPAGADVPTHLSGGHQRFPVSVVGVRC